MVSRAAGEYEGMLIRWKRGGVHQNERRSNTLVQSEIGGRPNDLRVLPLVYPIGSGERIRVLSSKTCIARPALSGPLRHPGKSHQTSGPLTHQSPSTDSQS
jgi:hypothetical protein